MFTRRSLIAGMGAALSADTLSSLEHTVSDRDDPRTAQQSTFKTFTVVKGFSERAVNHALTAGAGGVVYFPPGLYCQNVAMSPRSGTTLWGPQATLMVGPKPDSWLNGTGRQVDLSLAEDVVLDGFTFRSPPRPLGLGLSERASVLVGGRHNTVKNCRWNISQARLDAVLCKNSTDARITDNFCEGGGIVYAYFGASRSTVLRNTVVSSSSNGLTSAGNNPKRLNRGSVVQDNFVIGSRRMGIEEHGSNGGDCVDSVIRGNTIVRAGGIGISAVGSRTRVVGNRIVDCGGYAALESRSADNILEMNEISLTNPRSDAAGIVVNDGRPGAQAGAIVQRNCVRGLGWGISTANHPHKVVIRFNQVEDWFKCGISASDGTIVGNVLSQTRGAGSYSRYGIQVGSHTFVKENHLSYRGTDRAEESIKLNSGTVDVRIVGNVVDGGGQDVMITTGGGIAERITITSNVFRAGASIDRTHVRDLRVDRNRWPSR